MRLSLYQPDMAPNVGAAMRLAACFGVPLDIIEPCGFPLKDKDIRRVAMDYENHVFVERHPHWQAYHDDVEKQKARTVLLTTKGAASLWDFSFRPGDRVLMGRESAGVPDNVHEMVHARIVIPLGPKGRSLNVVNAASIALAEASRQLGLEVLGRELDNV